MSARLVVEVLVRLPSPGSFTTALVPVTLTLKIASICSICLSRSFSLLDLCMPAYQAFLFTIGCAFTIMAHNGMTSDSKGEVAKLFGTI